MKETTKTTLLGLGLSIVVGSVLGMVEVSIDRFVNSKRKEKEEQSYTEVRNMSNALAKDIVDSMHKPEDFVFLTEKDLA